MRPWCWRFGKDYFFDGELFVPLRPKHLTGIIKTVRPEVRAILTDVLGHGLGKSHTDCKGSL